MNRRWLTPQHLIPLVAVIALSVAMRTPHHPSAPPTEDTPYVIVLGIAQDGGVPQAGAKPHTAKGPAIRRHVV